MSDVKVGSIRFPSESFQVDANGGESQPTQRFYAEDTFRPCRDYRLAVSVADALIDMRTQLSLSQDELAKATSIDVFDLSRWESGDPPPADALLRLATFAILKKVNWYIIRTFSNSNRKVSAELEELAGQTMDQKLKQLLKSR